MELSEGRWGFSEESQQVILKSALRYQQKKKTNSKIVRITGCDLCCKRTAGSINSQSVIKKLNSSHTKLFQSTMRLKLPLESPGGG